MQEKSTTATFSTENYKIPKKQQSMRKQPLLLKIGLKAFEVFQKLFQLTP
jgi:hypothetical protein